MDQILLWMGKKLPYTHEKDPLQVLSPLYCKCPSPLWHCPIQEEEFVSLIPAVKVGLTNRLILKIKKEVADTSFNTLNFF